MSNNNNQKSIDSHLANKSGISNSMPSAVPFIIGNEAAERFNYYGLRAILTTFMVSQFFAHLPKDAAEAAANAKTHDFVAMSYLLPLFGGMVSDWFWGKYKTILYLSIVYAIGNILLAVSVNNETIFTSALMLIALGAGGIKPCVSANVGDQFGPENQHLMSKAFSYFYASINAGSLLSILLIPYLKTNFGSAVAFAVPAAAMLIATLFFWAGRNKYIKVPPSGDRNKAVILVSAFVSLLISYLYWDTTASIIKTDIAAEAARLTAQSVAAGDIPRLINQTIANKQGTSLMNLMPILYPYGGGNNILDFRPAGTGPILGTWAILILCCALIFRKQWFAKPGNFIGINLYALFNGGFGAAAKEFGEDKIDGIRSVWRVFSVFAFVPIFWALWDQSQSEWVVQATKMDLKWLGIKWEAEQISFVNAFFILAFIPFFNVILFPMLERNGIKVTPLRKIGAGLVITALSFVIIALIQHQIDVYEPALTAVQKGWTKDKANLLQQWVAANPGKEAIKWEALLNAMTQEWVQAHNGINIFWQILAFVVLTAAEVLVSITCLEYAYTQSPPSMKSTIMASYLLTVTIGNVIVSVIQNSINNGGFFAQFHGEGFFWLFTGICFVTALIFMLVSPLIKEKSYIGVG